MLHALYSIMVSVIVIIAVPVSQLRTMSVRVECCCPDPANCHCAEQGKAPGGQATIKACHKTSDAISGPSSPDVARPAVPATEPPSERIIALEFPLSSPHEPPSPARPPGPS